MTNKRNADPLGLLSIFASGAFTVGVNGIPLLKVDAESRSVDIEARGVKECGLRLSDIIEMQGGGKGVGALLKGSESAAKGLSEMGWRLKLYEGGSTILTMGSGVSRLTGYVHINPMNFRKVLEAL